MLTFLEKKNTVRKLYSHIFQESLCNLVTSDHEFPNLCILLSYIAFYEYNNHFRKLGFCRGSDRRAAARRWDHAINITFCAVSQEESRRCFQSHSSRLHSRSLRVRVLPTSFGVKVCASKRALWAGDALLHGLIFCSVVSQFEDHWRGRAWWSVDVAGREIACGTACTLVWAQGTPTILMWHLRQWGFGAGQRKARIGHLVGTVSLTVAGNGWALWPGLYMCWQLFIDQLDIGILPPPGQTWNMVKIRSRWAKYV
jgi:hypothetical protein